MTVIRRNPANRLAAQVRRPGGLSVADALQAAHDNLKSVQAECLAAMDIALADIDAVVARCRREPAPADLDALYTRANEVLEIAGVFGMQELGDAAFSLCDLVDRFRTFERWNLPALEVHLQGLRALRAAAGIDDAATGAVLDGLRQVAARAAR